MKNYDSIRHVKGESLFIDDLSIPSSALYCAVYASPIAHGKILSINLDEAKASEGVVAVYTHSDIPGENQIGGIIQDEELLASDHVHFIGEPIALIVAKTQSNARLAAKKVKVEFEKLEVITDPKDAFQKGSLIVKEPKVYISGNVDEVWDKCDLIIEDTVESGGQEHLYLETQSSLCYPTEGSGLKIISSTQNPTAIQRTAAKVLNIPTNQIESEVSRLGGGFGGKEDQATAWACLAALAAYKLKKPVKIILSRQDDMKMTGKRHPYTSDYKIGFSKEGKILAYEVTYFQNSGAAADLSTAILDRTMAHCTNSYFVPNVKATGWCCKTNLPPNTAFRGFGGPQGMFVIESAIHKASKKLGMEPYQIQAVNLFAEGDEFPYGQKIENGKAKECWERMFAKYDVESVKREIDQFNTSNKLFKKGFALMPICFGISFTHTMLNQASALVHVYSDGSVGISTGAIEMGQGVNMKIRQVAANIFNIDGARIKSETTNTTRNANTSATAASSGADLNGNATAIACNAILKRLINFYAAKNNVTDVNSVEIRNEKLYVNGAEQNYNWTDLILNAYQNRIDLSEHSFYATPEIYFDTKTNKGKPFAYHVYGTALTVAKVDCLRGTYEIESVKIIHDFGQSINKVIDRSQTEGALMQGIGWVTLEEIIYNVDGKLLTDNLSTYKVPDINFTPKDIDIEFLENSFNKPGPMNSKAIGEPPFMYGIGAYFALRNAVESFKGNTGIKYEIPLSPERVLMNLYEAK
ncbi:MAG: molybdopterin-dependent oxidoreductase [Ignavibacteriae bacterium]|nr:molybdopterin-dependent oxidoreductase [Ignavibacteriota bacterium]